MLAEIKPRLATNVIFTTVVVTLLTWKWQFTRFTANAPPWFRYPSSDYPTM